MTSTPLGPPSGPALFGDLLALSRRSWIRQMASGLRLKGYDDYRPSDAAVFRRLLFGPIPVGELTAALGGTRQAARKVAAGLERRGYAMTQRDVTDARRLLVSLTPSGQTYARAVVEVIEAVNRELTERVDSQLLAAARVVLLEVISGERRGRSTSK
jgi:DNA-binding MarR family transcriptional regulator